MVPDNCPNCGAPLQKEKSDYINNRTVVCEFCGSKFEEENVFTKEKAAQAIFSGAKNYHSEYVKSQKETQEWLKEKGWYVYSVIILTVMCIIAIYYVDMYAPALVLIPIPIFLIILAICEYRIHKYYSNRHKK